MTSRTADSVSARHILVPVERTDASEIDLLTTADSLEALGENLTLGEAAGELGLEATPVDITEDFPFVLGAGQVREGSEWAFAEAEEGDVSPVFENAEAFYALELVGREPEEVLPLEQARSSIERTLRLERRSSVPWLRPKEPPRVGALWSRSPRGWRPTSRNPLRSHAATSFPGSGARTRSSGPHSVWRRAS